VKDILDVVGRTKGKGILCNVGCWCLRLLTQVRGCSGVGELALASSYHTWSKARPISQQEHMFPVDCHLSVKRFARLELYQCNCTLFVEYIVLHQTLSLLACVYTGIPVREDHDVLKEMLVERQKPNVCIVFVLLVALDVWCRVHVSVVYLSSRSSLPLAVASLISRPCR
jgi:hypothetical protein